MSPQLNGVNMAGASRTAERRQRRLNEFTKKYLKGVAPLIVDGDFGHSSRVRLKWVKFYLGYGKKREDNTIRWTDKFAHALASPKGRHVLTRRARRAGIARRLRQRARWAREHVQATIAPGVTRFDGVPCRKSLVPHLTWARAHGWQGRLVSGWRSPSHSLSLCRNMCGFNSCPGRCAGLASNHVRTAIDVSDFQRFGALMVRCPASPRIFNALGARDPVHFSPNGR